MPVPSLTVARACLLHVIVTNTLARAFSGGEENWLGMPRRKAIFRHRWEFRFVTIAVALFLAALGAGPQVVAGALAAECDGPLPADQDTDAPGTDACPASLPALKCGEIFYVRQDGKGAAPTTAEGALGPAQFNDPAHWADRAAADDGKIGPGDCVRLIGTVSGPLIVQASGSEDHPISIMGDDTGGRAQLVGSVPFKSTDYVWFKTTDGDARWFTEGAKSDERCTPGRREGCSSPGIAATLGLENCRVLWVDDRPAKSRGRVDFQWTSGHRGKGDRLTLNNPQLVEDPNAHAVNLRCAQHIGKRSNSNTCGAAPGLDKYFCEGLDHPSEIFALYTADHSYIDVRSLRVAYADIGVGFAGGAGRESHDHGHNSARCMTFKAIDRAGVSIERQHAGNDQVHDSAFYDTGDGIYVYHPDGGAGHAFCRNYFVGINDAGRNLSDGHAIGLQNTRDVTVAWNYIERARKPIGLWAWKADPQERATSGVKVLHNRIIGASSPQPVKNEREHLGDGAGIILYSGSVVYGNEIAYNLIEDSGGDTGTLITGILVGGPPREGNISGTATGRAPNRFVNNTIVGARTSFMVRRTAAPAEFTGNISYDPKGMHVKLLQEPQGRTVTFENNLYYPVDPEHGFETAGGKRLGFEDWRRQVGGEARSLVEDPQLEKDATGGYRLRDTSPARARAIGADVTSDADRDDAASDASL
jgi:hypothetical protein